MTTSIGLMVMVALLVGAGVVLLRGPRQKGAFGLARLLALVLAGVVLLRGPRQKGAFGLARLLALVLAGLVVLFLVWMVMMVLWVGPHMRAM